MYSRIGCKTPWRLNAQRELPLTQFNRRAFLKPLTTPRVSSTHGPASSPKPSTISGLFLTRTGTARRAILRQSRSRKSLSSRLHNVKPRRTSADAKNFDGGPRSRNGLVWLAQRRRVVGVVVVVEWQAHGALAQLGVEVVGFQGAEPRLRTRAR